jgi:hypothetical protein
MLLSLVDAITSGLPSPLRIGMSPGELVAVLGSTEYVVERSRYDRAPAILKYGDLEFHFEDRGLARLFSDVFVIPTGTDELVVEPGWIARSLLLSHAEDRLAALGVAYRVDDDRWNEGCVDLVVAQCSSMKFRITASDDEHAGLVSFSVESDDSRGE